MSILCKVFVPYGALGTGITEESFQNGINMRPDAIACDAGSTDSGPYYLGTGKCKYADETIRADFRRMIVAGRALQIPVLVGTAGTCGTDQSVDHLFELCREILTEEGLSAKVARIYCSQDSTVLKEKYRNGDILPLKNAPKIDEDTFSRCTNIVGLAGAEPFKEALAEGADIVICGRATDTAILAVVPLLRGALPGACWHAAKTAECGSLCTTDPSGGGVFLTFDEEGFIVEPTSSDSRCTPYSVSAHMLYENANPYLLREPSGELDTRNAVYTALDERRVKVTGSAFRPLDYTIKLEGSALYGYQTMTVVGIKDERIMRAPEKWLGQMKGYVLKRIGKLGLDPNGFELDFKLYGYNALSPAREGYVPEEIGIVMIVTAPTQELATRIAKLFNPYLLHFPVKLNEQLPTFALLFSPAEIEKGPVYQFMLNHSVKVQSPMELFRIETEDIT